ncbi:MAG TPA: hypothetical protein VGJ98_01990 [Candidatus Eisenbacteria bacterium]
MDGLVKRALVAATVALLSMADAMPASASLPPGYFVDSTQAVAERPMNWVEADGDFTLSVHRRYEDPLGARLLGIAEATYPPRDRLVEIAIQRGFEIGPDSSRVPLWWVDGLGAMRVPYAVTAGALEFYAKLTERFRSHNFRGAFAHNLFWTDLEYKASIAPGDQYFLGAGSLTKVYVAEMSLSWGYDDGTFVPVAVARRIVVLASDGTVLSVEGDGETRESVFLSSHRGIGRVERVVR